MTAQAFDVVVIGAGPAGLQAAAIVAEAGLRCVAIDRMGPGGQLMNLGTLRGVEGLDEGATGPDLLAQLADRAMSAGAEIAIDDVARIAGQGGGFVVEALDGRYAAKAVIIATGLTPGTTGLADEARFEGLGLSHCAHCDAPLYAGKPVVVAGRDAWAVEEAIELAENGAQVTLVADGPLAASERVEARVEAYRALGNGITMDGRIVGLIGEGALEAVVVDGPNGKQRIPANGLFPQTGRVPATGLLNDDFRAVGTGHGLFLAGDVREGATCTLAGAIADGTQAGHNAEAWVKARRGA